MSSERSTEMVSIRTADDLQLRAELSDHHDPVATAVICHPHPLYGGNMYNNVVSALFDHLSAADVACIRFDFRGGGGSEGRHGDGRDEPFDVLAAVDEMAGRWPDRPLLLAGYSFGADVSLAVADERIGGWLAVAPPLRIVPVEDMAAGPDPRPKLIASGSDDDFRPPDQAAEATAGWTNVEIRAVEGANHFFMVGLDVVCDAASDLLRRLRSG